MLSEKVNSGDVTLKIFRKSHYFAMLLPFYIMIGNKKMGVVKNGQKTELSLPPGNTTIWVTTPIGYRSNKINFNLKQNENIDFVVNISLPYWKQVLFLIFVFVEGGIIRVSQSEK